ncbi:hypothetical protein SB48_HM08orf00752 [Heyndrickxia coagulans]|uniref:Uncharacterized protein n=1 Tax=Heyndrickxia coagulans TaxID=1398 RepID=A0AAN0WAP6_HEYCO|nr:hypothetical protein SB48_HM08orf00752 [Heyndrickxia coagulans]
MLLPSPLLSRYNSNKFTQEEEIFMITGEMNYKLLNGD